MEAKLHSNFLRNTKQQRYRQKRLDIKDRDFVKKIANCIQLREHSISAKMPRLKDLHWFPEMEQGRPARPGTPVTRYPESAGVLDVYSVQAYWPNLANYGLV